MPRLGYFQKYTFPFWELCFNSYKVGQSESTHHFWNEIFNPTIKMNLKNTIIFKLYKQLSMY